MWCSHDRHLPCDQVFQRGLGFSQFAYKGEHLGDDRAVRANKSFNIIDGTIYMAPHLNKANEMEITIGHCYGGYFEVTIELEKSDCAASQVGTDFSDHCVSIGLVTKAFKMEGKQVGWDQFSYGYHSDDGHKFHCQSQVINPLLS